MSYVLAPRRRLLLALQVAGPTGLPTSDLAELIYGRADDDALSCVHNLVSRARRQGFAILNRPTAGQRVERGYQIEGRVFA